MSNEYKDWMVEELDEARKLLSEAVQYLKYYGSGSYAEDVADKIIAFLEKE